MLHTYFPVLLLLGFVIFNAIVMLGLSHLTLRPRPTPVKQTPYESGIPPLGDAHERFSVKFYMVAVLFIIFDIETVFMIPWAVAFRQLAELGGLLIVEMFIFILVLGVGYVYIWKRGALEWD